MAAKVAPMPLPAAADPQQFRSGLVSPAGGTGLAPLPFAVIPPAIAVNAPDSVALAMTQTITVAQKRYLPVETARSLVEKIQADMLSMKVKHERAVAQLLEQFKKVEIDRDAAISRNMTALKEQAAAQLVGFQKSALEAEAEAQAVRAEKAQYLSQIAALEHRLKEAESRMLSQVHTLELQLSGQVKAVAAESSARQQAEAAAAASAADGAAAKAELDAMTHKLADEASERASRQIHAEVQTDSGEEVSKGAAARDKARDFVIGALHDEKKHLTETVAQLQGRIAAMEKELAAAKAEVAQSLAATAAAQSEAAAAVAAASASAAAHDSISSHAPLVATAAMVRAIEVEEEASASSAAASSDAPATAAAVSLQHMGAEGGYVSTAQRIDGNKGPVHIAEVLSHLQAHASEVIKAGESLWADKKKRVALRLYQREALDLLATLPLPPVCNLHPGLAAAVKESEHQLSQGLPAKAAVALKQGLEGFVSGAPTDISRLRQEASAAIATATAAAAAAQPAHTVTPAPTSPAAVRAPTATLDPVTLAQMAQLQAEVRRLKAEADAANAAAAAAAAQAAKAAQSAPAVPSTTSAYPASTVAAVAAAPAVAIAPATAPVAAPPADSSDAAAASSSELAAAYEEIAKLKEQLATATAAAEAAAAAAAASAGADGPAEDDADEDASSDGGKEEESEEAAATPATPAAKPGGGAGAGAGKAAMTTAARSTGSTTAAAAAKPGAAPAAAAAAAASATGPQTTLLKLKEQEKLVKELRTKIRTLEAAAVKASAAASAAAAKGPALDDKAVAAAVDKAKKEWEKKAAKDKEEADKAAKKEADANAKRLTKLQADADAAAATLASLTVERDELKKRSAAAGEAEKERDALRAVAEEAKALKVSVAELTARSTELDKLYREEQTLRKRYWNMLEDMKGKIRVYARARPLSGSELERGNTSIVTFPDSCTIDVATEKGKKSFVFDSCFGLDSTQEQVFADCENLIQSAFDGYNVCVFAYGQTGSGKTFTMVGYEGSPGLTPRAVRRLFDVIGKNAATFDTTVSCYMVELYNDNLVDLLRLVDDPRGIQGEPPKLEIKKDDKGIVTIKGAVIKDCNSDKAVMDIFYAGNSARHVGATNMNATSSRSHLIFALMITSYNKQTKKTAIGKISLVDLAGSERVGKTGATAERLKEAQAINKSLSALGNVISALSTNEKFIPYRDNKLTQLMSDSLGGNAKTLMFVNLSPADYNAEETVSSLVYASRVKLITNSAEKTAETAEIARLKKIIASLRAGGGGGAAAALSPAAIDDVDGLGSPSAGGGETSARGGAGAAEDGEAGSGTEEA